MLKEVHTLIITVLSGEILVALRLLGISIYIYLIKTMLRSAEHD